MSELLSRYKSVCVNGKSRLKHIVIWEQANGRPLPKDWVIHHIDGNGHNNSIDNLVAMPKGEHVALHRKLRREGNDPVNPDDPKVARQRQQTRESSKRSYYKNRDKILAKKREYNKSHRDQIREYDKKRREEHRDETNARKRQHHAEHREEDNAKQRQRRAEHLEEARAYQRKWHAGHREELNAKQRQLRAEHREEYNARQRQRRAENREKYNSQQNAYKNRIMKVAYV